MPAKTVKPKRTPITPLRLEKYYTDMIKRLGKRLSTPGKRPLSVAGVVRFALDELAKNTTRQE